MQTTPNTTNAAPPVRASKPEIKMCGFDKPNWIASFSATPARFLRLREGDGTRNRLLKFHDRYNLPSPAARLYGHLITLSKCTSRIAFLNQMAPCLWGFYGSRTEKSNEKWVP